MYILSDTKIEKKTLLAHIYFDVNVVIWWNV